MKSLKNISFVVFLALAAFLFADLKAEKTKICLNMIVKNEEKIIERCLESAKGIVDYISISDTGSTDNTVAIIENYLEKNGISGIVHHHEWENFGLNRTLSVEAAQNWLQQQDEALHDTYILLLDADMILQVSPAFSKDALEADSYLFEQKDFFMNYWNTRLIRASLPWKSIGVTHEYWGCPADSREEKLETLWIDDRNDGGCKSDKFERDIRFLTQGLEDEPNNERYMFYLAGCYKALGEYADAIKWYTVRINAGGWYEEIWYSKFMIGVCYEEMDQWDKALGMYLEAFQYNPKRAENLHQIAKYYRFKEEHHLAYYFAELGKSIPYPSDQTLFISSPVYDYLLDEHLSISGYYTPFKNEGFSAVNRLILKRGIPEYVKELAKRNMLFYIQTLDNAAYEPLQIDLPLIREGLGGRYNPMNPSIQKTETGYHVICRTVNYIQIGAQHFESLDVLDPKKTIRTRNFLIEYDKNFKPLSQMEIVENLPRKRCDNSNVEGLEDCRMFSLNDSIWFTCTTSDTNPTGQRQVSLCKLSDLESTFSIPVETLIPLPGPNPFRCEKNWLPFVKDDALHLIYSYEPLTLYKPTIVGESCEMNQLIQLQPKDSNYDFSAFSGSAPPIEFDQGYLMLIHEVIYDTQRNYLHRFVYLDNELNICKVSKPFIYLHKGVEYCCGMTIDHSGEKLIMSIGIEDREAYLCLIDLDYVRALLEP